VALTEGIDLAWDETLVGLAEGDEDIGVLA